MRHKPCPTQQKEDYLRKVQKDSSGRPPGEGSAKQSQDTPPQDTASTSKCTEQSPPQSSGPHTGLQEPQPSCSQSSTANEPPASTKSRTENRRPSNEHPRPFPSTSQSGQVPVGSGSIRVTWNDKTLRLRNPINFAQWITRIQNFLIQAAVSNLVQHRTGPGTTPVTTASAAAGGPGTVSGQQPQAVIGTLVAGAALPASLPLSGGTITLVPSNPLPPASTSLTAQIRFQGKAVSPGSNKTVRDMLNKREGEQAEGGKTTPRTPVIPTAVRSAAPQAKLGVIDLTDDVVHSSTAPTVMMPPGLVTSTTGIRPATTTLLVQQTGKAGGTPLLLQPVGSQAAPTLIYTSRPGQFVVQSAPSAATSLIRPVTAMAAGPPSLQTRPSTAVSLTTSTNLTTRPPPPLQPAPGQKVGQNTQLQKAQGRQHPAPLPAIPPNKTNPAWKKEPPKPGLKISRVQHGIVLSWNMSLGDTFADVVNYQLFAYQETSAPPQAALWKKVGDVKALPLPMACTLTQFQEGNKYHFSVRAVDTHGRLGPFSDAATIHLEATAKTSS